MINPYSCHSFYMKALLQDLGSNSHVPCPVLELIWADPCVSEWCEGGTGGRALRLQSERELNPHETLHSTPPQHTHFI